LQDLKSAGKIRHRQASKSGQKKMNGDKAQYSNLKENQLALSYKGWR